MGIVSQQRWTELMAAAPVQVGDNLPANSLRSQIATAIGVGRDVRANWKTRADEASAIEVYEQIKNYIMQNGYFRAKVLRPWEIDNQLYAGLDRAEPWWGFEFETGYTTPANRAAAIAHVWDNYDGVCFDAEGEGQSAVEITFGPQEMSKFADGTAQALRFIQWLDANPQVVYNGGQNNVGTHVNMSHPQLNPENRKMVCGAMNRTLAAIPSMQEGVGNVRQLMFGRNTLYGGFFEQGAGGSVWLEGKLFRTTYTAAVFQRYIRTCEALTKSLKAIVGALDGEDYTWQKEMKAAPYVDNLYEVAFAEAEPVIRWSTVAVTAREGINDGYTKDKYVDKTPQTRAEVEKQLAEIAEKKRIIEERTRRQKELTAQYEKEQAERQKLHAAGKTPAGMPDGYFYCDDCEDFHDENSDSIYYIHEIPTA